MKIVNREHWLTELGKLVEPLFGVAPIKPWRVACGWPSRKALSAAFRMGECHVGESSSDGRCELFISPRIADALEVAGTLTHELAHVAAGPEHGHKAPFVHVCKRIGLTHGKPAHVGPGPELTDKLRRMLDRLGPYPHAKMVVPQRAKRRAGASSIKLACEECDCEVRITFRWLDDVGPPVCGCGGAFGLPSELIEASDPSSILTERIF